MVADNTTFSHISVTPDDEDDMVIHAGVRPAASPASVAAVDQGCASAQEEARDEVLVDASDAPSHTDAAETNEESAAAAQDARAYRETKLEDLESTPMSTMQKVIIGVALLLVVAFFAYYIFLR